MHKTIISWVCGFVVMGWAACGSGPVWAAEPMATSRVVKISVSRGASVDHYDFSLSHASGSVVDGQPLGTVIGHHYDINYVYSFFARDFVLKSPTGLVLAEALGGGGFLMPRDSLTVHDSKQKTIGKITRIWFTNAKARFNVYDDTGHLVAYAVFVNEYATQMLLLDPSGDVRLADFARHAADDPSIAGIPENSVPWYFQVYQPDAVDQRLIFMLGALLVDIQSHYKHFNTQLQPNL